MPQLDIVTRFRQYQALPKCKSKTPEQICQMMMAENKLNHQEYLILKQNVLIFPFGTMNGGNKAEDIDWRGLMGVRLTAEAQTKKMDRVQTPMIVNRQYHKQAPFIEVDSKGKIDMSQFTLEGLKQRYDSKKYDIIKEKSGDIVVRTKIGNEAFRVKKLPAGGVLATNIMGTKFENAEISKKGEVCVYSISETAFGKTTTTTYQGASLKRIHETYPNGNRRIIQYNKDRTKEFEIYWDKGNAKYTKKEYSNGILWKLDNGKQKVEYPLVNELVKDLTALAIEKQYTRPSLKKNILQGITGNNIAEIWDRFEKQTGKTFIDFLRDKHNMDSRVQIQCINHIEKLFIQNYPDKKKVGEFIAERLYEDINRTNNSELNNHIKLLNKNNIKHVMAGYRTIADCKHDIEQEEFNDTMETVRRYLPEPLCTYAAENLIKKATPFRGLLEAIDTSKLSTTKKKELIKYITDTAMKDKNVIAIRNAQKDIASHPRDMHKVEIDLYRVQNAENGDMRNQNINKSKNIPTNREFIGTTRMQGRVGDCWLIAGLNSVIAKPKMLAKLNELVSYDNKTGKYTIMMKGPDIKYVVTSQEISEAGHLSSGSLKTRAVEIAMDKYIKEEAYLDKYLSISVDSDEIVSNVDLNGGYAHDIWHTLWGFNANAELAPLDIAKEDFNNPNRSYAFCLTGTDNIYDVAKSEKDPNCVILAQHEYSIIGSDRQNVFVLNPWDSSDVITISRAALANMGVFLEQFEIPRD